jgi:uncharacterized protein (DUF58 family)
MSLRRAAVALGLAVLPLAGLLTGSRILYVLFAYLVLLLLAGLAQNLWAAFTFTYTQSLDRATTIRGRPVRLALRILNEKPFPYSLMRIRLATADPREARQLDFNLAPRASKEFDLLLECPHRGEYPIGMTVIDFVDLFGLVRLPFDMRLLAYYRMPALLVYPRTSELRGLPMTSLDNKSFARSARSSEDPQEPFSSVRPYRPGDSQRRIHWKASARQRTLLTRQFDPTEEPRIRVLVDLQSPPWTGEAARQAEDALCECAASVLQYLLRQDWPLEVASHGRRPEIRPARGMQDFPVLHRWLATVPFSSRTPLPDQLVREMSSLGPVRSLLVFTTGLGQESLHALQGLKDRVSVHVLVCGPAQDEGRTREMAATLRRGGLPAWALLFGEDPAQRLGGPS